MLSPKLFSFGRWLLGALWLLVGLMPPAQADDFLPVEQAFVLSAAPGEAPGELLLRWQMAPGYHLYRERLAVQPAPGSPPALHTSPLVLPNGLRQMDMNFGRELETYAGTLNTRLTLQGPDGRWTLQVGSQGCADAGLCYPPTTQQVQLELADGQVRSAVVLPSDGAAAWQAPPAAGEAAAPTASPRPTTTTTAADGSDVAQVLHAGRILPVMGVFWLAGLLLSFTPCVLPMVPILSSIIVGQGAVSRRRGFVLALAYSLGMALVYTGFGMLAGWLGEGLAAYLQNPWVLGAFALLLTGLALSMFGWYELQLPSALQSRLSHRANQLPGGRLAGVFVMGGISALIVGPCVAAPLAGALVYIGQTHDLWLGGAALFALALGMSVPLLLVGLSAGTLLPRAGAWMTRVKQGFGVLLLAVAWWLLAPVLPASLVLGGWGLLLLGCAVPLWHSTAASDNLRHLAHALGLVLAVVGVAELGGALSGGRNPLQPLAHWVQVAQAGSRHTGLPAEPGFRRIRTVAELDAALAQADRPVMLDFYADWCVACQEMAAQTFSDPAVAPQMARFTLLQADVTANTADDRALLKRFGLFGPPGLVFFQPGGQEQRDARVIGFMPPAAFLAVLARLG